MDAPVVSDIVTWLTRAVLAVTVAASLGAGAVSAAAPSTTPTITPASTAAIDAATDTAALMPAVRLAVPAIVPVAVTAPAGATAAAASVVNRSNCRTGSATPEMTISIADISYSCPVYAGGQSTIDAGHVTLVTDRGTSSVLATHPGDPGTLWIAAHRTSHGGAFAAVPDLADGALVVVSDGVVTATYRIVSRAYVTVRDGMVVDASGTATSVATLEAIIRADRSGNLAPRLVLQTCDGDDHRWMIYADLVV